MAKSVLRGPALKLYQILRPPVWDYPIELLKIIAAVYPTLDFEKVVLYKGLPWFVRYSSWISGITLPHDYKRGYTSIYIKAPNPASLPELSLLVHEYFHVMQYQQANQNFFGIGYINGFLANYLAGYTKHGYRNHPLEIPAYDFEAEFEAAFSEHINQDEDAELAVLTSSMPESFPICNSISYKYQDGIFRWIPAALLTLVIGLFKPFVEIIILSIVLLLLPLSIFYKE